jgi:hypothetical protein
MLKFGGYLNILIAIGHIIGLIWADNMFAATGITKEMTELAHINYSLPYLLTVVVAIAFFIGGLYGLSADNKFRRMPFLKPAIFTIAGIYLFRGLGKLVFDLEKQNACSFHETLYSLIAIIIGLLFLIGGLRKWKLTKTTNR